MCVKINKKTVFDSVCMSVYLAGCTERCNVDVHCWCSDVKVCDSVCVCACVLSFSAYLDGSVEGGKVCE